MDALFSQFGRRIGCFVREQDGVAASEYAVMLALLIVVALGAFWLMGGNFANTFSILSDYVPGASADGSRGPSGGIFNSVYSAETHLPQP